MTDSPVYIEKASTLVGSVYTAYGYVIPPSELEAYQKKDLRKYINRISAFVTAVQENMQDPEKRKAKEVYFLGTEYSVCNSVHTFDMQMQLHGPLSVSPLLFPYTVLNAPACHLSIENQMDGPVFTVCTGKNSSLDAIGIAFEAIRSGQYATALAGGFDEIGEIQSLCKREAKPLCEAVGFLCLSRRCAEENLPVIKGYSAVSYAGEEVSKKLEEALIQCLKKSDLSVSQLDKLAFCTDFEAGEAQALVNRIKQISSFKGEVIVCDKDYMGASGIVQIASLLEKYFYRERREIQAIINVSCQQISIIIIE